MGMPRRPRTATGGYIYHVLNRAVNRATVFHKDGDYVAFERVLRQAKHKMPMRLLAYCLMPNHFHLVLWPHQDGELSDFLHWLTLTHTMRCTPITTAAAPDLSTRDDSNPSRFKKTNTL